MRGTPGGSVRSTKPSRDETHRASGPSDLFGCGTMNPAAGQLESVGKEDDHLKSFNINKLHRDRGGMPLPYGAASREDSNPSLRPSKHTHQVASSPVDIKRAPK